MGKDSAISWTDHTWNPWWGCTKLPDRRECDRCYAEGFARRVGRSCWGPKAERRCASPKVWSDPYTWDRAAAAAGKPASVFCMSMGDIFEARADLDPLRERAWKVMRETPHLIWLLLTKRPGNAPHYLPADLWLDNPRVLIGATVGTQAAARTPYQVDFLSCEPLLEEIDIWHWFADVPRLKTIIIGGESNGPRIGRECKLEWAHDLSTQCGSRASVYVKQLHIDGRLSHDPAEWPADLRTRDLAWRVG